MWQIVVLLFMSDIFARLACCVFCLAVSWDQRCLPLYSMSNLVNMQPFILKTTPAQWQWWPRPQASKHNPIFQTIFSAYGEHIGAQDVLWFGEALRDKLQSASAVLLDCWVPSEVRKIRYSTGWKNEARIHISVRNMHSTLLSQRVHT